MERVKVATLPLGEGGQGGNVATLDGASRRRRDLERGREQPVHQHVGVGTEERQTAAQVRVGPPIGDHLIGDLS